MKKIVYIAQSAGGVAEYLYMLLSNMNSTKYDNILIVSEDYKNQIDRFKKLVTKIYFVPMTREIEAKSDIRAIIKIRKLLKQIKPNIVYLHSSKAGAIGRMALLFNFKTKIIYNAHGWYFNAKISKRKKKIFALIERILAVKTNKIINISKNEYNSALLYKISKKEKQCIIENGIDFKKFENCNEYRNETRKKYSLGNDIILIGQVGRMSEQKDPFTAIKAFNDLCQNYKNVKLMFVGDGDLKENIIDYAEQNGIRDKIIITGWVENVQKYIPAFDIAILPSKWEGFGLAIVEYMACEKPIIASNVGGITNIIENEKNGYLIQSENHMELSNRMKELIDNMKIREKFIDENKKILDKYEIKNVVKKHEILFKNLTNDIEER